MSENANLKRSAYLHTRMPWRFGVSLKRPRLEAFTRRWFSLDVGRLWIFLSENHPKSSPKAKKVVLKLYQHRPQTVKTIAAFFNTHRFKSGFKGQIPIGYLSHGADKRIVTQKLFQFFQSHQSNTAPLKGPAQTPPPSPVQARQSACACAHVGLAPQVSCLGKPIAIGFGLFGCGNSFLNAVPPR